MHVAIVSLTNDLHALLIQHYLRERGVRCSIVEVDRLPGVTGLGWTLDSEAPNCRTMPDRDGQSIDVEDLDVVWWRRLRGPAGPRVPDSVNDDAARDLIANDCIASFYGIMMTGFSGNWVSDPEATRAAENKLVQLKAARETGFALPDTLISNDPVCVRAFCEELRYNVIAKPVAGTGKTRILTGRVTPELVADDERVALSPAIYQEAVAGDEHLRVCAFGSDFHAVKLRSRRLDWRVPLDCEAEAYRLDEDLRAPLAAVLAKLGLRMGIFDLKISSTGEPVWLEVNPRGSSCSWRACAVSARSVFFELLGERRSMPSATPDGVRCACAAGGCPIPREFPDAGTRPPLTRGSTSAGLISAAWTSGGSYSLSQRSSPSCWS